MAVNLPSAHAQVSHMVLPVSDVQRSRDWYVDKLNFALERELEGVVGIKDRAGLTIFLIKSQGALAGEKITLTIQVDDVDRKHQDLVNADVTFASHPQRQFWGYGAEVLDPDGYMNHLWDESTMRQVRREATD
jgi:catechol 2,3-dioxygenase-like lactoylglutathione lyase family enzyme